MPFQMVRVKEQRLVKGKIFLLPVLMDLEIFVTGLFYIVVALLLSASVARRNSRASAVEIGAPRFTVRARRKQGARAVEDLGSPRY